ncbi:hypothetical protein BT96DRAFT_781174, partial [Gymnopus androsaceus JB14]
LIGTIQKVNTNNHIGGEMEATLAKSFVKSANLRRWLNRKDCPELVRALKDLFNKSFKSAQQQLSGQEEPQAHSSFSSSDCAHYTYKGVNYSRAQTHLGNSLVRYYPSPSSNQAAVGSIQQINIQQGHPIFYVQRQESLPSHKYDPFRRYPWFFAKMYSSRMSSGPLDIIPASSVFSHVARYNCSGDRAVILTLSRA